MHTLVALDLETTGLDPQRDAVIEIGVVRFRGDRIEDEWSTLVNPGRPLPPFVAQLTGIQDAMLTGAPRLSSVLSQLQSFVGDLPVLGHSVHFDLSFLQPRGLFRDNASLDTFDLASVLLPSAPRYRLTSLAAELGVPVSDSHRALADAQTTRSVFVRLLERARQLPPGLVEEIVRIGAEVEWGAGWVFESLLREMGESDPAESAASNRPRLSPVVPLPDLPSLRPVDDPPPMPVEELAAVLEPGGAFARVFPGFEHRPPQLAMLRAVSHALSEGRHSLIEAGTGTGKSMAYLLPAFAWAELSGHRVVVSTNTLNLQDQLIRKDIPDLRKAVDPGYRASVLKGRSNYLCPRRWDAFRRLGPRTAEEMRLTAKILVWLAGGGSGDRGEITLMGGPEAGAWVRISAEGEDCSREACRTQPGGVCPYESARAEAESAHVIIVNHALLLADIATGHRVLPEYRYLIVDEAHHLESATTQSMGVDISEGELLRLLRDLGPTGLMGQGLAWLRRAGKSNEASEAQRAIEGIAVRIGESLELTRRLFSAAGHFLDTRRDGAPSGPFALQSRILPSTRSLAEWGAVEMAWEDLRPVLSKVVQGVSELGEWLVTLDAGDGSPESDLSLAVRAAGRDLEEAWSNLDQAVFHPGAHSVYWLEESLAQGRVSFHSAPLEVGPMLERFLWHEKDAVIMTSATLTTAGEFDYLRRRLGADEAEEVGLGSPFDYETSTLLYLVNDIPEPAPPGSADGRAYQAAFERGLMSLVRASRGRALVLFTSYDQLRRTAQAISEPLAAQGILVFEQGEGASRYALLESFRSTEQAVLLGTRSFWEGVDVPGEALSVLVVPRLPFDVPSDPIIAARSETYDSPFDEYTLPEAILRFRQGFGRLIRTRSDRGVVAVFDRRILSKRYGTAFVDSLPRCTLRAGRLADLPQAAARWLGEGSLARAAAD
ncbi:MAG: helicase C-terminal domain-containing protein [Anaerolineales bacterium]